jgi:hypothetical protein
MTDDDFEQLSRRAKQAVEREQAEVRLANAPPRPRVGAVNFGSPMERALARLAYDAAAFARHQEAFRAGDDGQAELREYLISVSGPS